MTTTPDQSVDLDALEKLLAAVAAAPPADSYNQTALDVLEAEVSCMAYCYGGMIKRNKDADRLLFALHAAAPELLRLVREAAQLREENESLRGSLEEWQLDFDSLRAELQAARERIGVCEYTLTELRGWAEGFLAAGGLGHGIHLATWPPLVPSAAKELLSRCIAALSPKATGSEE